MRMFAAIKPSDAALEHLDAALSAVGLGWPLRVVPVDQRHITLAFYGEVPEGAVPDLSAALARELGATELVRGAESLTLSLAGAGCFSARSLWMGVRDQPTGALHTLAEAAGAAAISCGLRLPDGDRPRFRAHLTVARMGARAAARADDDRGGRWSPRGRGSRGRRRGESEPSQLEALAQALAVYRGPSWEADAVELLSSRLGEGRSGGPLYETLVRLPL